MSLEISSAVARRKEVSLDGTVGDSKCVNVESAVDKREEWSLVILSVKKDANLSAREDAGEEEGRIVVGLRCRMIDSLPEPFGLKLVSCD